MPRKYDDFVESAPVERRGKLPPHTPVKYVDVICPHCKSVIAEIGEELVMSNKASLCLKHLRVCDVFKLNGGMVAQRKPTAVSLEMAELKAKVRKLEEKSEELHGKTVLYDSVLTAVMPSLTLPLTAPIERAQLAFREAAMRDLQPQPLALAPPSEVVPLSMHTQMIEEKNTTIEEKKATIEQKDAMLEHYRSNVEAVKREAEAKDSELLRAIKDKMQAEQAHRDASVKLHEAERKVTSLASRVERLEKERRELKAKQDELTGKTRLTHGQLLINSLEQAHRQSQKRRWEGD